MQIQTVYLNGQFMPIEEARIPVLDRGFIFGDGVYEVIPIYSGHPFRLRQHLGRLQNSLDAIKLANPMKLEQWVQLVRRMVKMHPWKDQAVYLQVTRGVAKRDHAFPKGVAPTVFVMSNPMAAPDRKLVSNGVACITATDNRWLRCDIKSTSLLGNVLMRQRAAEAGCIETIMFRDGFLSEASSSNVFVVHGKTISAPPNNHLVLPGTTNDVVMELARKARMPLELREVSEDAVRGADEIWLTSATKEVLAVSRLDGKPVGSGKPGPVFKRMHKLYQDYKRTVMRRG
ncbi:MAG: D-amino acid aminotransferase [Betaproteobacteria bacterium]|nr:MAG: D-amino acid aminotransferase [Betaproteobacteria bacterium]